MFIGKDSLVHAGSSAYLVMMKAACSVLRMAVYLVTMTVLMMVASLVPMMTDSSVMINDECLDHQSVICLVLPMEIYWASKISTCLLLHFLTIVAGRTMIVELYFLFFFPSVSHNLHF